MRDGMVYAMPEGGGPTNHIHIVDAPRWSQDGYGIFWTVNEFAGTREKKNITAINGFAVDMDGAEDGSTKPDFIEIISKGLLPTWVIETVRGYHVYFLFKEPLSVTYSEELDLEFRAIMMNKLIPFYNADNRAKDLSRILRVPNYLHRKFKSIPPFMVQVVVENEYFYDWATVDRMYEDATAKKNLSLQEKQISKELKIKKSDKLFDDVYKIPCKEALEKLSGHAMVRGEQFTFRRTGNGNENIFVNEKGTSCWIDKDNRIGSLDSGGPTIWQWLRWYGNSHKEIYQLIRTEFLT